MIGYRFLPPAEEEVIGASLFYRAASEELGQDFLDEVQSVVDLLREQPKLGRSVGRGLRRALLKRFPFALIYAYESDIILVVAVAHQSRRPRYWRRRIDR